MGLLDIDINNEDIFEVLANKFISYKKTVMVYVPNYIQTLKYGGIIGEIGDDMVITSESKFIDHGDEKEFLTTFYWIDRMDLRYSHNQYTTKRGQYHCEYSAGQSVTPEYITKWILDRNNTSHLT